MKDNKRIPFNRPSLSGKELQNIEEAIALGHCAGDGPFTKKCSQLLEGVLGVKKALLTTSCTHALEMAALLLDLQPGDEFIVPAFTFVSTANAFALRGAKPIFIDIRPDTLNLDERLLESLITPRTKAIVPIHYAGVGCEMDAILAISERHQIPVIEDNAHGLFGKYRGRPLGTFGQLATQSFHETKNFICGEGGALLINDARYIERAEIIREKGTDRSKFFRGQVDKYGWVDIGSSFLLSDILAAFLFAQLEAREKIQTFRRQIWERYEKGLVDWAGSEGVALPVVPADREQAYHMFYLLFPDTETRDAMIQHLKRQEILSVFHYTPLNTSRYGQRLGGYSGQCPITEDISNRLLRLPFFNDFRSQEQERVIDCIRKFSCDARIAA